MLGRSPGNAVSKTTNCHKDDCRREPSLDKPKYRAAGWTVKIEKATGKQIDGIQWVEAFELDLAIAASLQPGWQLFGFVFSWKRFASLLEMNDTFALNQFSARSARLWGISTTTLHTWRRAPAVAHVLPTNHLRMPFLTSPRGPSKPL